MNVPWGEMIRRAALFGVEPAAFWRLSLKEWRWLVGGGEMSAMTGAGLERLAQAWPDEASPDARSLAAVGPPTPSGFPSPPLRSREAADV